MKRGVFPRDPGTKDRYLVGVDGLIVPMAWDHRKRRIVTVLDPLEAVEGVAPKAQRYFNRIVGTMGREGWLSVLEGIRLGEYFQAWGPGGCERYFVDVEIDGSSEPMVVPMDRIDGEIVRVHKPCTRTAVEQWVCEQISAQSPAAQS